MMYDCHWLHLVPQMWSSRRHPNSSPQDLRTDLKVGTASFKADPWQAYARLRSERPVLSVRLPTGEQAVIATRYADVSAILRHDGLVKNPANVRGRPARRQTPRFLQPLTRNMLALDEPDHIRLKRLVQAAFTPRRVEQLTERTRSISAALLDRLVGQDSFDLVNDYALPLPVAIISDLLGVPDDDRAHFAHWSRTLIRAGTTRSKLLLALPQVIAFVRYLDRLVALKRAAPADDLVSDLVHDAAADRLDGEELMAMIAILVSAGHETTTNLIGNGMLALLRNSGEHARLATSPALIDSAVEELLRFAGPVEMSTPRFAREDMEIAGVPVPRATPVFGVIASANRDEMHFSHGHQLDLGRQPNRHLTFGEGGHYCVGASLARMEGRVAFNDLIRYFPTMRLTVPIERLHWRPHHILRGLVDLPVRVA